MTRVLLCLVTGLAALASDSPSTQQLRDLCRNLQPGVTQEHQKAVESLRHLPLDAIASFGGLLSSQSEDDEVRVGAAVALGTLGAPARPYIPELAKALNGTSIPLAQVAAGALADLVDERDAAVVPDLVKRLVNRRSDCTFECFWTIIALGKIGPSARSALPVLRQIVKDKQVSSAVQGEALASLRRINASATP